MKVNWRTEIISLFLIAAMFVLAAITWPVVPDRIPVHWGFSGQPDRYGGKFEGLLLLPLISLGIYLFLLLLPRIDPRGGRYQRFAGAYLVIRTVLISFFVVVYVVGVLWARGVTVDIMMIMSLAMGLLFMVIGNYMGKLRPNWFAGIRTPWTLSSVESWNKTHRLGGKLFIAVGLIMAFTSLFQKPWTFLASIGLLIVCSIGLVVYSYYIWRADPAARSKNT
jgi:uncharacterized membrane protein